MKIKSLTLIILMILGFVTTKGQLNVGSASAPDGSAMLQVTSSTKGFLPPSMSTLQRNAISNPAVGLLIFNTNTLMIEVNIGTMAIPIWNPSGSATLYNGDGTLNSPRTVTLGTNSLTFNGTGGIKLNAGTIDISVSALTGSGDSIGTIVGLGVQANGGLNIGENSIGNNIYIGYRAGQANTKGGMNQFIGMYSGNSNTTGEQNFFDGFYSGYKNTWGYANHFNGLKSGFSNTSGTLNYFSGYLSGYSNTTGSFNQFTGFSSGYNNTIGDNNHFNGLNSGKYNTTGRDNQFTGLYSGYTNTTGNENLFTGNNSGFSNTTGSSNQFTGYMSGFSNSTGSPNYFSGYKSGYSNTMGYNNQFIGFQSGYKNTTGSINDFNGYNCGYNNTTGTYNQFNGYYCGYNNTTGVNNHFSGIVSGYNNTSGHDNQFTGQGSGWANTTGSYNQFSGKDCGVNNTVGSNNLFIGFNSGRTNLTGSNNTALGNWAGPSVDGLTNSTAIGNGASVGTSNTVRLGNNQVTKIEGQVAYTYPSDARFKYNVQANVPGIAFIKKLRPVTYQFDIKKLELFSSNGVVDAGFSMDQKVPIQTGFLAQEVEKAAMDLGIVFDGVHAPINNKDHYSIAYSQFVMPLVKAVQEQQDQIDQLNTQLKETNVALAEMRKELNALMSTKVASNK